MSTKAWLQSILAAFITAFSTGAVGALALPTVFNFTHDGLWNLAKLTLVPALINVFTFLKQSPLPTDTATVTATVTKTAGMLLFIAMLGASLTGCSSFERNTFNSLAASKAVIDQAQADYTAKTIPQTQCDYALINDAKAAQTVAVNAMLVYETDKAAGKNLDAQTAVVTADVAAIVPVIAQVKLLYTNPSACGAKP